MFMEQNPDFEVWKIFSDSVYNCFKYIALVSIAVIANEPKFSGLKQHECISL